MASKKKNTSLPHRAQQARTNFFQIIRHSAVSCAYSRHKRTPLRMKSCALNLKSDPISSTTLTKNAQERPRTSFDRHPWLSKSYRSAPCCQSPVGRGETLTTEGPFQASHQHHHKSLLECFNSIISPAFLSIMQKLNRSTLDFNCACGVEEKSGIYVAMFVSRLFVSSFGPYIVCGRILGTVINSTHNISKRRRVILLV